MPVRDLLRGRYLKMQLERTPPGILGAWVDAGEEAASLASMTPSCLSRSPPLRRQGNSFGSAPARMDVVRFSKCFSLFDVIWCPETYL